MEKLGNFRIIYCELINEKFYGLDMSFCPLTSHLALWYPSAFSPSSQKLIKKEIDLITVNDSDANNFVCNSIVIGKNVLIPPGCSNTKTLLEERDFTVDEVDLSEFLKAGGAHSCMLLKIE